VSTIRAGTVYLVGAGPGDPGLLTVRARSLLGTCDAIVYDALVSDDLLPSAAADRGPSPEMHFVGKRGGDDASARQEDISALLVDLARAGKSVVRLKGGDPFVFGRGGEEAQALAAAGIPFEVVPGVTAGIAGPAYAGIPVTHRGLATAVTFVTGSEDPGKPDAQTDWAALARAGGTIVLYMGVRRLPAIATALMAGGLAADTPAAAVQWATYPAQRTITATVATLADAIATAGLTAPVVTIIGRVAGLRDAIRWFDLPGARPLLGRRILVTRASEQASALAEALRARGASVVMMPALRIEPLDPAPLAAALARLRDYAHLILTSQNAVRLLWDALRAAGLDARALQGVTVSAVGPATADALLAVGIAADVRPDRSVAEGLLDALRTHFDLRGARVLYPAAEGARDVLPDGLRRLGATVDVLPIYRSVATDREGEGAAAAALRARIRAGALELATFASASAVRGYVAMVGPALAAAVPAVSIGPITSDAARRAGLTVIAEASEATIPGVVDAVTAACRSDASAPPSAPTTPPAATSGVGAAGSTSR